MPGLHHLAIQVRDLGAMERFYTGLFGLNVVRRWPDDKGGERSVWLGLDSGFLALEKAPEGSIWPDPQAFGAARPGFYVWALGISLAERVGWEARLQAAGVAIERRTAFSLFFFDPEGNRLAVSHHPEAAP